MRILSATSGWHFGIRGNSATKLALYQRQCWNTWPEINLCIHQENRKNWALSSRARFEAKPSNRYGYIITFPSQLLYPMYSQYSFYLKCYKVSYIYVWYIYHVHIYDPLIFFVLLIYIYKYIYQNIIYIYIYVLLYTYIYR